MNKQTELKIRTRIKSLSYERKTFSNKTIDLFNTVKGTRQVHLVNFTQKFQQFLLKIFT